GGWRRSTFCWPLDNSLGRRVAAAAGARRADGAVYGPPDSGLKKRWKGMRGMRASPHAMTGRCTASACMPGVTAGRLKECGARNCDAGANAGRAISGYDISGFAIVITPEPGSAALVGRFCAVRGVK